MVEVARARGNDATPASARKSQGFVFIRFIGLPDVRPMRQIITQMKILGTKFRTYYSVSISMVYG